jgi:hypothetical protein
MISRFDVCRRCRENKRNAKRVELNRRVREHGDLSGPAIEAKLKAIEAAKRRQKWMAS